MVYMAHPEFKPRGLVGISDHQIEEHWKLYEGYVNQSNTLIKQLFDMREGGEGANPLYADRRRRLGFEMAGMVVHEYYFRNLKAGVGREIAKDFHKIAAKKFGSFEAWLADFKACAATRGVGHAMCFMDPLTGDLNNHFIELHHEGPIPGFDILLALDVWEHAYLLDYGVTQRADYIAAFCQNVAWDVVEERTQACLSRKASPRFDI